MVRGGQREGAGRKSTWASEARFEDTTVIRVPKNIKVKLSDIAYRLDAGEDIDLDSNSKIQELESKLLLLQLDNEKLLNQLENKSLDLETQSKKIQELEQENNELRNRLNNLNQAQKQLVTNSKQESHDLVTKPEGHTQLGLLDIVVEDNSTVDSDFINDLKVDPLQSKQLALRISVTGSTLSMKKFNLSSSNFLDWIQSKDPDGIRWVSLGGKYSKGYTPADDTPVEKLQLLKIWIQDHT